LCRCICDGFLRRDSAQNSGWCTALPLPAIFIAGRRHFDTRRKWLRFPRLRDFYESAQGRFEDRWQGNGFSGEEFRGEDHVYDADLRVLGTGSLFEPTCTARTGIGRRRLAEYLLNPCQESTWAVFAEWTQLPAELAPGWVRVTALVLSV
jgi:hypothetical protein